MLIRSGRLIHGFELSYVVTERLRNVPDLDNILLLEFRGLFGLCPSFVLNSNTSSIRIGSRDNSRINEQPQRQQQHGPSIATVAHLGLQLRVPQLGERAHLRERRPLRRLAPEINTVFTDFKDFQKVGFGIVWTERFDATATVIFKTLHSHKEYDPVVNYRHCRRVATRARSGGGGGGVCCGRGVRGGKARSKGHYSEYMTDTVRAIEVAEVLAKTREAELMQKLPVRNQLVFKKGRTTALSKHSSYPIAAEI
ncbi:MAG: hypothetical protein M1818_002844 [Claussenomyces sp. TS43310]|nr:MAG: hypothetical protein M1818_002844 [Claussenomyces sp. TS43310]